MEGRPPLLRYTTFITYARYRAVRCRTQDHQIVSPRIGLFWKGGAGNADSQVGRELAPAFPATVRQQRNCNIAARMSNELTAKKSIWPAQNGTVVPINAYMPFWPSPSGVSVDQGTV
jgi:hypothetical protein